MTFVRAAESYQAADDIGVIAVSFNPARYRSRQANMARFLAPLRACGVALSLVDASTSNEPPASARTGDTHHVGAGSAIWQKERLLRIAEAKLPAHCTKVVWLDADVLFADAAWLTKTSRALATNVIAQPFSRAIRLRRNEHDGGSDDDSSESFASVYARDPSAHLDGRYDTHGHTGFAWAARRDLVRAHGFFDLCIVGGADHVMAHAFAGDALTSRCVTRLLGDANALRRTFDAWASAVAADVAGRIGVVQGDLLHLFHGELEDRRYLERNQRLARSGFDPQRDLALNRDGVWEWSGAHDQDLERYLRAYFVARREDG